MPKKTSRSSKRGENGRCKVVTRGGGGRKIVVLKDQSKRRKKVQRFPAKLAPPQRWGVRVQLPQDH